MRRLLEVVRHPLDSKRFHQAVSKKQWFLLFNVAAIVALALTGRVKLNAESLIPCVAALGIVNWVAWLSSKHYPDWK